MGSPRTCSGLAYWSVIGRSPSSASAGSVCAGIEQLGDAEVEQLGHAVGGDQDVARLQIPVDHQVLVGEMDGGAHLPEERAAARAMTSQFAASQHSSMGRPSTYSMTK